MKSLVKYIKESCSNNFFDNLDYKVSYNKDWNKDGTHYTRKITVTCTPEQLKELNNLIWNSDYVQKSTSGIKYKKSDVELKEGDNFTRLSVSKAFDVLSCNKKGADKHNTIIKIKLLK